MKIPALVGARRGAGLALLAMLAGCVPAPEAPPAAPAPLPAPAPEPSPPPTPIQAWDVAPLTAGDWRYVREGADSVARFGIAGTNPTVTLRCRAGRREIALEIASATLAGPVMVRTSAGNLSWPGTLSATALNITRPAHDAGLDWIAFSRGRIAVEAPGQARLILPVWAEISRVIEDCRG